MTPIGSKIAQLIKSVQPAILLYDNNKQLPSTEPKIGSAIGAYIDHNFQKGKEGERFESDHWRGTPGWFVAVPEIISYNGIIYFECRWWNWVGGFSSQETLTPAEATCPDGEKRKGWIVYKQGKGYQSNSQYFVGEDGSIFEYKKQVIGHDPVRYMATGGTNVGWTETIISEELTEVKPDSSDLNELFKNLSRSVKRFASEGLREIMTKYFKIG